MKELRYTLSVSLASVQNANEIKQSLTAPPMVPGTGTVQIQTKHKSWLGTSPF